MKSLTVLLFLPEMQITLVWCIHAVTQQVCQKKPTVEDLQPLTLSSQVIQDLKQMTLIAAGSIA